MPEVVEVEWQKQGLQKIVGDIFKAVHFVDRGEKLIRPLDIIYFSNFIVGTTITRVSRLGKHIVFELSNGQFLVSHLMMTGSWLLDNEKGHTRIIFELSSDRRLYFNDTRLFGRLFLMNLNSLLKLSGGLDVLTASREDLLTLFLEYRTKQGNLKEFLLNQNILTGLGNVYANEILFRSGFYPGRSFSYEVLEILPSVIKEILAEGMLSGGLSMKDYFHVDGTKGFMQDHISIYKKKICPSCNGVVLRTEEFDGRATYFCPTCQV